MLHSNDLWIASFKDEELFFINESFLMKTDDYLGRYMEHVFRTRLQPTNVCEIFLQSSIYVFPFLFAAFDANGNAQAIKAILTAQESTIPSGPDNNSNFQFAVER